MKKSIKAFLSIIVLTLILSTVFALVGCDENSIPQIENIRVILANNAETLILGENATIDSIKGAITIEAVYNDDSTSIITDFEIEGFDPNKSGEQTITVKYGQLQASFKVQVEKAPDVHTVGVSVDKESITLEASEASVDGIKDKIIVTAKLSDDNSVSVDKGDYTIEGFDPTKEGEQTVTIKHSGFEATLKVTINFADDTPVKPVDPDDPVIPVYSVKLIVNGDAENAIVMTVSNSDDPNVTAQYAGTITLAVGDTVEIIDSEGFKFVNYEPNCGFSGTATVAGSHDFYAKKYLDGGDSVWVTVPSPSVNPDNPDNPDNPEYSVKIIVNGDEENAVSMEILVSEDSSVTAQYTATVNLAAGDVVKIIDSNGFEFVNYEQGCNFNGTVVNAGNHTFYAKKYSDGGDSIWVTVPSAPVNPDAPEFTENSVVMLSVGDVSYTLNCNPSSLSGAVEFYIENVELKANDVVSITVNGIAFSNYKDCGFNGTAEEDGKYNFYVESAGIWVEKVQETPINPDTPSVPTITAESVVKLVVGENEIEFDLNMEASSLEYMLIGIELKANDVVSVLVDGVAYTIYKEVSPFQGTAGKDGYYDFYVSNEGIYASLEYEIKIVVGDNAVIMEIAECTEEGVTVQYMGKITLEIGDEISIFDNYDNTYANYQDNCTFKGTALVAGEHTIYVKKYADGHAIWVTQPEAQVDPTPSVPTLTAESVVKLVVGENEIALTLNEEADAVEFMVVGVEHNEGDVVVVTVDGVAFAKYKDTAAHNGTIEAAGKYNYYISNEGIWNCKVEEASKVPTIEEGSVVKLVVGENEIEFDLNTETSSLEYMLIGIELKANDVVSVLVDGVAYTIYKEVSPFQGTAGKDGYYDFYVSNEGIYASLEYEIKIVVGDNAVIMEIAECTEEGVTVQYMGKITLEIGDEISIFDNYDNTYANYQDNCTFKGTALVAGEHTIYVKKYADGHAIWVTQPEAQVDPDNPDTPDNPDVPVDKITVYYYNENNWETVYAYAWADGSDGDPAWPGAVMTAVEDQDGWFSTEIISANDYIIFNSNADDKKTGNLSIDAENPYYNNHNWTDGFNTYVYIIKIIVNNDEMTAVEMSLSESDNANVTVQYTGTVTLEKDDVVKIIDSDGFEFKNYEWKDDGTQCFTGTATVAGDHTFYAKKYLDGGDSVWVAVPAEVVDPVDPVNPDSPDVPGEDNRATIYYYNHNGWSVVKAYAWNGSGSNAKWSGVEMSKVEDQDGWYSITFENNSYVNIIFNDGSSQTGDLVIDYSNPYYNGYDWTDGFNVYEGPATITVYFHKSESSWSNVYAYSWADGSNGDPSWPGAQMKAVDGKDNWFEVEIKVNCTKIIFNNGNGGTGNQTENIVLPGGTTLYYNQVTNNWQDGFDVA